MFFDSPTVRYYTGNVPVIVTSQHDGYITHLYGVELPLVFNVSNDEGTRELVEEIAQHFEEEIGRPYVMIYKIKKSRSSWELYQHYLDKLLDLTCCLVGNFGACAVFDVHRFHARIDCKEQKDCDFIFGTDWRNNVIGDLDIMFARLLQEQLEINCEAEHKIFVPPFEQIEGARFGATGKLENRVIQSKWLKERVSRCSTIQIEIYKALLDAGKERDGIAKAMAKSFSLVSEIL